MRTKLVALLVLAFVSLPAVALAAGPSGSKENKKGEVKCGEGTDTPIGRVYAGGNGVELCSGDNSSPDGRIIVSFDGQYVSVDGDPTNAGFMGTGFVRLDSSGPSCGDAKHHDSTVGPGGSCA